MRSSGRSTSIVLVVLILFYILLTAIVIIFFQQIMLNITSEQSEANTLAVIVLIILPMILLAVILINIYRLFRERMQKMPGAQYKIRLIFFFALVAFLSAIPQSALSVSFLNSVINSEFIAQINDSWDLAVEYYQGKVNNLRTFGSSTALPKLIASAGNNPEQLWKLIHTINPEIQFFQILNKDGENIFFAGIAEGQSRIFINAEVESGMLPKIDRDEAAVFRYLYVKKTGDTTNYLVFGIYIPPRYVAESKRVAQANNFFEELKTDSSLQFFIILFYFLFSIPILLVSIIISFYLSEEVVRPIMNLEEATRRVAGGDLSIRILTRSSDELGNLIDSFNQMVSELDYSKKKLSKTEKIAAWQEIAQRLAHEIKNPLTPIRLAAERIQKKYTEYLEHQENPETLSGIIMNSVHAIVAEVSSLDKLLKEFSEFAKLPDPSREATNIRELIDEMSTAYSEVDVNVSISVENIPDDLHLMIDRNQFKQVFANLFINAIQAMPNGGTLFVRSDLVKKEKNNYCRIQVRDTGTGIEESVGAHIFDPYFTTKKSGNGLGLSIVERIIFDHNGNIWFESQMGVGTTFFIDIPMETE